MRTVIPKHSAVLVECCVASQPLHNDITMILKLDVNSQWPESKKFCDTLVQ